MVKFVKLSDLMKKIKLVYFMKLSGLKSLKLY